MFPSKQAGIAGMAVSFSIARGIARPEGRSDKKKSLQKIVLLLFFFSRRRFNESRSFGQIGVFQGAR